MCFVAFVGASSYSLALCFPHVSWKGKPALNVNSSAAAYPFVARLYYMRHIFYVDILFDAVADFYNIHSLRFCVGGSDGGRDTRTQFVLANQAVLGRRRMGLRLEWRNVPHHRLRGELANFIFLKQNSSKPPTANAFNKSSLILKLYT